MSANSWEITITIFCENLTIYCEILIIYCVVDMYIFQMYDEYILRLENNGRHGKNENEKEANNNVGGIMQLV